MLAPVGDLLDLVLPRACLGCGRPGAGLCAPCARPEPCPVVSLGDVAGVAAAAYEGAVRRALIAYKERGRRDLCRPLAALLAAAIGALEVDVHAIVPVPSSAAARRARGGDHVVRLARATRLATVCRQVRLARAVRDSAGLDTAARAANLAGAMRAGAPPPGVRTAVVVDDIVTTGATAREAIRALRAAGWHVGGVAVVAATRRRDGTDPGRSQQDQPIHLAATPGRSNESGLT